MVGECIEACSRDIVAVRALHNQNRYDSKDRIVQHLAGWQSPQWRPLLEAPALPGRLRSSCCAAGPCCTWRVVSSAQLTLVQPLAAYIAAERGLRTRAEVVAATGSRCPPPSLALLDSPDVPTQALRQLLRCYLCALKARQLAAVLHGQCKAARVLAQQVASGACTFGHSETAVHRDCTGQLA